MEQLSLDLGITNIDDALTDRQTDRQPQTLTDKKRRHIKGNRWLLLTNSEELEGMNAMRLQDILYSFPELEKPYVIKEEFRNIYLFSKTRAEAEQAFEQWKTTINDYPEYLAFADTVENWRTEIFNYFDFRFTNSLLYHLTRYLKRFRHRAEVTISMFSELSYYIGTKLLNLLNLPIMNRSDHLRG